MDAPASDAPAEVLRNVRRSNPLSGGCGMVGSLFEAVE